MGSGLKLGVMASKTAKARAKATRDAEIALRGGSCTDCHSHEDDLAEPLEFDHLPEGKKLRNVSRLVSKAVTDDRIKCEMSKCELRCHECHKLKTIHRAKARAARAAELKLAFAAWVPPPLQSIASL